MGALLTLKKIFNRNSSTSGTEQHIWATNTNFLNIFPPFCKLLLHGITMCGDKWQIEGNKARNTKQKLKNIYIFIDFKNSRPTLFYLLAPVNSSNYMNYRPGCLSWTNYQTSPWWLYTPYVIRCAEPKKSIFFFHASEFKNIFTFYFALRACVTIPLSVVTALNVTQPLFLDVCCYSGGALLFFVPSHLIQLTACTHIRIA